MKRTMSALLMLGLLVAVPAWAQRSAREQQRIDYLIHTVATLKGATFIRNGVGYDAERASAHMRLKLRFAGDRVLSASDFITYCATKSSMSGRPYIIQFADGHTELSAVFLRRKLAAYRAGQGPATPGSAAVPH